jgi:hypothetical protein
VLTHHSESPQYQTVWKCAVQFSGSYCRQTDRQTDRHGEANRSIFATFQCECGKKPCMNILETGSIVTSIVLWDIIPWKWTIVPEGHVASIIRVKEQAKHESGSTAALLAVWFMLVSCLAYASTLKMEAWFSRMLVGFHQNMWHYIPEDRTLYGHCCEDQKSDRK